MMTKSEVGKRISLALAVIGLIVLIGTFIAFAISPEFRNHDYIFWVSGAGGLASLFVGLGLYLRAIESK